jgi:hypothetical protein
MLIKTKGTQRREGGGERGSSAQMAVFGFPEIQLHYQLAAEVCKCPLLSRCVCVFLYCGDGSVLCDNIARI